MIVTCSNCSSLYNDQTVNKCPACSEFKYVKIPKDRLASQILGFIKEDSRGKRKTATGYQHKVKTGSGGRI